MEQWWNDIDRRKQKNAEEHISQCHFARNPTWTNLGVKPGLHSEKLATNHLSCGTGNQTHSFTILP
jgi:hypothetical protein